MAMTTDHVKRRPGARPGFSLIEALIVVIILGVVGAMALPSVGRSMTENRADRAAQSVASEVESAFSLAARERKPVLLVVDSVNKRIAIVDRATSKVLQQRSFSLTESEYGLTRLAPSTSGITVFPNGLASGAFVIYAWANGAQRAVRVKRTGQIRVTMP